MPPPVLLHALAHLQVEHLVAGLELPVLPALLKDIAVHQTQFLGPAGYFGCTAYFVHRVTTSASRCLLVVAGVRENVGTSCIRVTGEEEKLTLECGVMMSLCHMPGPGLRSEIRYLASIVAIARHRARVAKTNVLPRLEINPCPKQPTELMCRMLRWRLWRGIPNFAQYLPAALSLSPGKVAAALRGAAGSGMAGCGTAARNRS